MSNKKARAKSKSDVPKGKHTRKLIVNALVGLAVSLCFVGVVAPWKTTLYSTKISPPFVPVPSPTPLPLAKEYVYGGSKLIAIEEPTNSAPTVNLTNPLNNFTFTAGTNLAITVSANDVDGTISQVQIYQGNMLLGSASAASGGIYNYTWNNVPPGAYSITAKATDNLGAVAVSAAVTVISNAAPIAAISSPANNLIFNAGSNLPISVNASDADGTVSQVQIFQGSTLLGTATAVGGGVYNYTWTNVAPGTYTLTARATDNRGAVTTSAAVNVISNLSPTVAISSPGNNFVFNAGSNLPISVNASDTDGTVSQVQIFQGSTLLGTATAVGGGIYNYTWTNVAAGTYTLTARATDNRAAVTISAAINVISNVPPTVSITSPANSAVFTAPASIAITTSASDADGTISKVDFYQGANLLGTASAPPFNFTWTNAGAGTYSITAKATDNRGAISASGAISVTVNPACTPQTGLIISEFRLRGPNGSNDEYVELYNNSDQNISICTADGSTGWALVSAEGIIRFVLAAGTVIPARAHFLAVGQGYSLSSYGALATGDLSYSAEIPDNTGVALFSTANSSNFTSANRLDAVGFTNNSNALYREGAGLTSLGANSGEYSFFRKLNSGVSQDTGDNVADFTFVATNGALYGSIQSILGAPGPENLFSPRQRNATLPLTVLDPTVAASVAPNRVRDTGAVGPNAALGTLTMRRTVTNNTGANVTRLRFRVIDITTLYTPGYVLGGSQADMRVLSSGDAMVVTSGSSVLVRGTTLETPPNQAMGGGLNSSLNVGVITLSQPLAPGQSINVQFVLGVQQSGSFRFFVNVEALP